MNPIRTLIIDDEWLIRSELKTMLQGYPDINVVGEAANLAEAVQAAQSLQPDLIFLDVQMPGGSGFEVLEQVGSACKIIVVTAFPQYLARAQEYRAVDYLLKPISKERLENAIRKLQSSSP
ncbi:response regulator [candidate division KSB1 bacterium]|nr:response regulator [candidate division KSB1 bacterium]